MAIIALAPDHGYLELDDAAAFHVDLVDHVVDLAVRRILRG
jgi:hypothetical protein